MLSRYELFSSSIAAIYHHIQKIERDEMIRYGYKGAFAQYLAAMHRHPEGVTSAQLCDICDKDKAAVSRAVAEMESLGLVMRETDHDTLYRARLMLTQEGRSAAEFVCQRAKAAVNAGGHGLSDDERAVLYNALQLIAGNLASISRDGIPAESD